MFATRVTDSRGKLEALRARLAQARTAQNGYLAQLAIAELEAQKSRIAAYELQARFALATIYDRASSPEPAQKPAAEAPK